MVEGYDPRIGGFHFLEFEVHYYNKCLAPLHRETVDQDAQV